MGALQNTVSPIGDLLSNGLGILVGEGWVNSHLGIGHAPFRDSTLTLMIKDCLDGECLTMVLYQRAKAPQRMMLHLLYQRVPWVD